MSGMGSATARAAAGTAGRGCSPPAGSCSSTSGIDWNARTEKADFILAFTPYFSHGVLFGTGGNFRIEWIPGLEPLVQLRLPDAARAPHGQDASPAPQRAPREAAVGGAAVGPTLTDETRAHLETLRDSARWLILHANFFNDDDDSSYFKAMEKFRADVEAAKGLFRKKDALHPEGRSYALESRHYDEAFDAAFASAVGPEQGRAVADRAAEILLDEVLLPYDRLIGRFKKPDTLAGFSEKGRLAFGRALDASPGLDPSRREAALGVFDEITRMLDRAREVLKKNYDGDERKVWMPLDLALRPEQQDSQEDIDAIVARALERPFTRGNSIFPTNGSRFQLELVRSLYEARDYHVLWIHDYAGRVGEKPDPVAHAVTTKGYLGGAGEADPGVRHDGASARLLPLPDPVLLRGQQEPALPQPPRGPSRARPEARRGPGEARGRGPGGQEALRDAVASSGASRPRPESAGARGGSARWSRST